MEMGECRCFVSLVLKWRHFISLVLKDEFASLSLLFFVLHDIGLLRAMESTTD
jgi:hypothetical protein